MGCCYENVTTLSKAETNMIVIGIEVERTSQSSHKQTNSVTELFLIGGACSSPFHTEIEHFPLLVFYFFCIFNVEGKINGEVH